MFRFTFPLLLLIIIFIGCSKPFRIEENKFIEIYTDLVIGQDTSVVPGNDLNIVKSSVFRKHGITAKEYQETLDYYNADPKRWDEFFNKTLERLERLKKSYEKKPSA